MGWMQALILLLSLSLPWLVLQCQGDPDENCANICKAHGLEPGVRVPGFFQQDCSNCGPPMEEAKD